MKIVVHEKGVILSGKAWEIKQKLKEYGKNYCFVKDWVENVQPDNRTNPSYHKAHLHIIKTN
jgi:hypothetical protein